jgi:uncharacterized protein (TIGR03437 family)
MVTSVISLCQKTATAIFAAVLFLPVALGQQYLMSTIAGGVPPPTPSAAKSISIAPPTGLVSDANGTVYFTSNHAVFKLDQSGVVTRMAGTSRPGYAGDGGPAVNAQLNNPGGLALDSSGNLFVVDHSNFRIRRISPQGIITTIVGNGQVDLSDSATNGGSAVKAGLASILAIATDDAGDVFFSEIFYNPFGRVRKVSRNGIISTVAGGGSAPPGNGGLATSVQLSYPLGLAVDTDGNLFISDTGDGRVFKVDAAGMIRTAAGTGGTGFSGDGGPATSADLSGPGALTLNGKGTLYVADRGNYRVRAVSSDGVISTVAGGGKTYPGDGEAATSINFCGEAESLAGLGIDASGNLFIAACWIETVTADGVIHILGGNGNFSFGGDGGPATAAQFFVPNDLALDAEGNIYVADTGNNRIRRIATDGTITTIAGGDTLGFGGDGGPASAAVLNSPSNLALNSAGEIFFADSRNYRIRKISSDGTITTIAGNGRLAHTPDGNAALGSSVWPGALAIDNSGNVLFAENGGVRKIDGDGILSTLLEGIPDTWVSGQALAVDQNNNVLMTDVFNNRILIISPDGRISTIAGGGTASGSADGPALNATILFPSGIAVDDAGNIVFADYTGLRILAGGMVRTIVSQTNPRTYTHDGGPAPLSSVTAIALRIDGAGRIYVVDHAFTSAFPPRTADASIRLLQPTNQSIVIGSVRSAASEAIESVSPGKIVVIYGVGMGPAQLSRNVPRNGAYPKNVGGTQVLFDGVAAPIIYSSATQVAVAVPYQLSAPTTAMTIQYGGASSLPYTLNVAPASPGVFSANGTGAGQVAAVNADGTINDATHPTRPGEFVSFYATGDGLENPPQSDGNVTPVLGPYPRPVLPANVEVGGIPATVLYAGAAPGEIAGLMQIVIQVPAGIQPGGYVPVQLFVGQNATTAGAAWIAVANK